MPALAPAVPSVWDRCQTTSPWRLSASLKWWDKAAWREEILGWLAPGLVLDAGGVRTTPYQRRSRPASLRCDGLKACLCARRRPPIPCQTKRSGHGSPPVVTPGATALFDYGAWRSKRHWQARVSKIKKLCEGLIGDWGGRQCASLWASFGKKATPSIPSPPRVPTSSISA